MMGSKATATSTQAFDKLLDVEEVASILEMHPVSVRRMLQKGILPGARIGKLWRISEAGLRAYLDKLFDSSDWAISSRDHLRKQAFDMARRLAKIDGYVLGKDCRVDTSSHPRARVIWRKVCVAFDLLLGIDIDEVVSELDEEGK